MAAIIERVLSCFQSKPKKFRVVFVLGGPGSGKGTLCSKIVETYGWVHLSAGDLLRAERKDPSSKHGELINEYIREGKIVPVEITLALIRKAMEASATTDFLVDGFPRSADNLKGWEDNMTTCTDVVSLLYLETSEEVMAQRIMQRSRETVAAGGTARADDNEEAIKKRLKTYHETTMPIIEIFKRRGKVTAIDSTPAPAVVFASAQTSLFDGLAAQS
jgi:UMP-CMP kinase